MKFPLLVAAVSVLYSSSVWSIDRIQGADSSLSCQDIASQQIEMKTHIDAGSTERGLGTAAVGGAANVGAKQIVKYQADYIFWKAA